MSDVNLEVLVMGAILGLGVLYMLKGVLNEGEVKK